MLSEILNCKSMMRMEVWGGKLVGYESSWGAFITRNIEVSTSSATFKTGGVSLGAESISTLTGSNVFS